MSNLSERVVGEIKDKKIVQLPKWTFLLQNAVIWSVFGVSILLGAIATAIVIFLIVNNGGNGVASLNDFLLYVPYFWLILLAIFAFVAYHNFQHTEGGYRLNTFKIMLVSVGISLFLGVILFSTGIGSQINTYFANTVPYYTSVADRRAYIWVAPESGRLAGRIISVNKVSESLVLRDLNNKLWAVSYAGVNVKPSVVIETDTEVKVIGTKTGNSSFTATEFRPMNGNMMNNNQTMMQGNGKMMRNNR